MNNVYLEKIAKNKITDTLEVSSDGYVHNHYDAFDERIKNAKNITPIKWNKVAKKGAAVAAVGAAGYGAKKLYDKAMSKKAGLKPEHKKELMQTGVIGATGLATGMLAAKIGKAIPKIGDHAGKMGALIGGLGLAGDYAAVKLNKHIEKKAESYVVKGHGGLHDGIFKTPKINLEREQYHQYARDVENHPIQYLPLGTGATLGGVAALVAHKRGGMPYTAGALGYLGGSLIGKLIANNVSHNKALENQNMLHPILLDLYKEEE